MRGKAINDKLHKTIDQLEIEHANRNHSKETNRSNPQKRQKSPTSLKKKRGDLKFFDE
jgi:hypothetical protein